jgi:hypothetical protein
MTRGLSAWVVAAALVLAPAAAADLDQATAPGAAVERKQAGDSLLFSRQVLDLLEAARQARGAAVSATPADTSSQPPIPEPAAVHLSAVLYRGPSDWQIWLNGRSFAQSGVAGSLEILRVRPDSVRLKWRGAGTRQPAEITLRPNQTYIVGTGEIVEGPPGRAWRAPRPGLGAKSAAPS